MLKTSVPLVFTSLLVAGFLSQKPFTQFADPQPNKEDVSGFS